MLELIGSKKSYPDEYYLNQYDTTPAKKLDLKEGDRVKFSRYVLRVGYKIEPKVYSLEEWNECGFQIIKEETGIEEDKLRKLFYELNLISPYKGIRGKIYKRLVTEVRRKIIAQNPDSYEEYNNRHIWLLDLKKEIAGQVSGTEHCQTGTYNKGHYSTYDEEWSPAFLSPVYYHTLYKVESNLCTYLVHPNDIKR